jgi:hypothetical protein
MDKTWCRRQPEPTDEANRGGVFRTEDYNTAVVRSTYAKVLILQAVVLAGLWILQQAFL